MNLEISQIPTRRLRSDWVLLLVSIFKFLKYKYLQSVRFKCPIIMKCREAGAVYIPTPTGLMSLLSPVKT